MTDEITNATQGEKITLSRTQFFVLCTVILLLAIGLILCWLQSPEPSSSTSAFEEAFNADDVAAALLLKEDGKFKLYDTDGNETSPCGKVNDRVVPDECNIEGKITLVNSLTIWAHTGSDCIAIYEAGDYLYDIHRKDDPNLPGNQKGKRDCHHDAGATHYNP